MAKLLNTPYKVRSNTTLNEKFNINTDINLEDGVYPSVSYYAIGVGGVGYTNDPDVYNFSTHEPSNAALFEHIPFIMRTLDNDLVESEQANYRFRKNIIINGVEYIAYYLKVIDTSLIIDDIYIVDVSNEVSKLSKFNTNDSNLLNPTPRDPTSNLLNDVDARYITSAAKLKFSLSTSELSEIGNVLEIIYSDKNKAISEIGVCSGVDMVTENGNIATNVQITHYLEVELLTQMELVNNNEIHRSIELGGSEPLIL